jgi:hypothetical protein
MQKTTKFGREGDTNSTVKSGIKTGTEVMVVITSKQSFARFDDPTAKKCDKTTSVCNGKVSEAADAWREAGKHLRNAQAGDTLSFGYAITKYCEVVDICYKIAKEFMINGDYFEASNSQLLGIMALWQTASILGTKGDHMGAAGSYLKAVELCLDRSDALMKAGFYNGTDINGERGLWMTNAAMMHQSAARAEQSRARA